MNASIMPQMLSTKLNWNIVCGVYLNPIMPVLAIAYERPRMPLPMIAFIRLKAEDMKDAPLT